MTDANSAAEVLEIKGLTKSLGSRNILCDINLSVNSGEVFGSSDRTARERRRP